jgi:hypothetical protein
MGTPDEAVGAEVFRKLLQVYPLARIDDYYKSGRWHMEVLETDMELIVAHRQEAGAPEPPPLEDVPMPALPGALTRRAPLLSSKSGARTPSAREVLPTVVSKPTPSSNGVAEIRQVAAFVSKWNLDSVRTKSLLSRLSAGKRRLVMETFKPSASNLTATSALERFIAQCEREPAKPGSVTLDTKRPREDAARDANKRPRTGTASPRQLHAPTPSKPSQLSLPTRTPKPPSTPPPQLTNPSMTRKVSTPSTSRVSLSNGDVTEERTTRRPAEPTLPPKVVSSEPPSLKKTAGASKPGDLVKNLLG